MHPYDPDSPEYDAMREAGRGPRRIPSEKGCAKTHPGLTHREWLTSGGDEHFALTVRDPAGPEVENPPTVVRIRSEVRDPSKMASQRGER